MADLSWEYIYSNPPNDESSFYNVVGNVPPEMKLPGGIVRNEYYFPVDDILEETIHEFITFINTHNHVHGGNITRINREIFDKIRSVETGLTILLLGEMLIGTIVTFIYTFHCTGTGADTGTEGRTSYTTYLCIHPKFRNHGLAMALIKSSVLICATRANCFHGYYLTPEAHWEPERKIKSWYRPIDPAKARNAGFQMDTFTRGQKNISVKRLGLIYHIKDMGGKCRPVHPIDDYEIAVKSLKSSSFYLTPSLDEWLGMCNLYNIYRVGDEFFFLFITSVEVMDTGKIVNNAYLSLVTSPNLLQYVVWASKHLGCILLCGLYYGHVTYDEVFQNRGSTTSGMSYLEMYNCQEAINFPSSEFHMPIF
jgi:GNAT superfamily N-acetyltransferase